TINALALQDALERNGLTVRTQSAITVTAVAEPYIRRRAMRHLDKDRVVIFAAGTGNPYMTTDTAAALRAIEIDADVLLMAKKNVDGVFESDPFQDPAARRFVTLSYLDALNRRLQVMDSTALSLCMENSLPIIVFDLRAARSIERAASGQHTGTIVSDAETALEEGAPATPPPGGAHAGGAPPRGKRAHAQGHRAPSPRAGHRPHRPRQPRPGGAP